MKSLFNSNGFDYLSQSEKTMKFQKLHMRNLGKLSIAFVSEVFPFNPMYEFFRELFQFKLEKKMR